jgi:hypothetical protein
MTGIATGIKRGTAIVTAVRKGQPTKPAEIRSRDLWGAADAKRSTLASWRGKAIDDGLAGILTDAARRWKFTTDTGEDFPSVDEYLTIVHSGVQPVRDEAVIAEERVELAERMRDYFDSSLSFDKLVERYPGFGVERIGYDPQAVRKKLLASSSFSEEKLVRFLYRPFDVRWLYWEPDHKLLNRARKTQIPYWISVPNQRCLVMPQTPRRFHATRPLVSTCVVSFAAAEPDARLFPLHEPSAFHGAVGTLATAASPTPAVGPEWVAAARKSGVAGSDEDIADAMFHALVATMNAPSWLNEQPVEADDFPQVPIASDPIELMNAASIGRRIAALNDPTVDVPTVTSGSIDPVLAAIGVPDTGGTVELEFGRFGRDGGRRQGEDVLWADGAGWRNIPEEVWGFNACGHSVLPKWLSYRVGRTLSSSQRQAFMLLCRRVAAIRALEADCDRIYKVALGSPLSA